MSKGNGSAQILDDLALAHALADLADAISLDRYQSQDLVVTTKPDNTPVTDADRAVETAIREALDTHRSGDGLVGEEFGSDKGSSGRYWVIDPIDGTKNFMRGVPTWATLIGLVERQSDGSENVIVGAVSAPALNRRWYASTGSGAFTILNGGTPRKISVSKVSEISSASIAYSDFQGWNERLEKFHKLIAACTRSRGYGDFWSHMLVAEGAVDIAAEPSLALWDMAALEVIVREAGGTFSNLIGEVGPFGGSGISTNTLLHPTVMAALN
jgi:histidinol-phosphatase